MADTSTPIGTLNMWHRSSDLTEQCPMRWLLTRLYGRDRDAGYFLLGTAVHGVAEDTLEGVDFPAALDYWRVWMHEAIAAAGGVDNVLWTKRRPGEAADMLLVDLATQWRDAVVGTDEPQVETRIAPYRDCELESTEYHTFTPIPYDGTVIHTQVDSLWREIDTDRWLIVDWKSGATAKANPMQLWVYLYAMTHDPGSPLYGANPDRVGLAFHHIAFDKVEYVNNYPGHTFMGEMFKDLSARKRRMAEVGFAPCAPDWYCGTCLVQSKCPLYGGNLGAIVADATMAPLEQTPEGS